MSSLFFLFLAARWNSSKWIMLTTGEDCLEVRESLKEAASLTALQTSMRKLPASPFLATAPSLRWRASRSPPIRWRRTKGRARHGVDSLRIH
jgi:hypothetical protein